MKRRQKPNSRRPQNPAYRRAFERLDAALDKNTPSDNAWKIRLLREAMFGEVEKLAASGEVKMPK